MSLSALGTYDSRLLSIETSTDSIRSDNIVGNGGNRLVSWRERNCVVEVLNRYILELRLGLDQFAEFGINRLCYLNTTLREVKFFHYKVKESLKRINFFNCNRENGRRNRTIGGSYVGFY